MSSISLINRVKYSKGLYRFYYCVGSACINLLKDFLKADNKMIVFCSFGGRKYDDSPKCIYEAMLNDHRFDDYTLVWAFINPNNKVIPRGRIIKTDTFSYYKCLLQARVWVTNSSMKRGLAFSGINTFEINTWHGTAIKHLGTDVSAENSSFKIKRSKNKANGIMLAQGQYDVDVFSKAFDRSPENFRIIGLPRNDVLAHVTPEEQSKMKNKLGIPDNKIVLLYAPTFREYDKDLNNNSILVPPIDFRKWRESLGDKYVVLFRAHYEVIKVLDFEENDFVKNVSDYPSLSDLMIASDMLVSDYSSVFFDYSIMHKPMISYCYDYDRYSKERGVYFDIREWISSATNEDELLSLIKNTKTAVDNEKSYDFQRHFVTAFGNASKESLNIICGELE